MGCTALSARSDSTEQPGGELREPVPGRREPSSRPLRNSSPVPEGTGGKSPGSEGQGWGWGCPGEARPRPRRESRGGEANRCGLHNNSKKEKKKKK